MILPLYSLHRCQHGWLVCGPCFPLENSHAAIPLSCFHEIQAMIGEDGVICPGVSHYYSAHEVPVVMAVCATSDDCAAWEKAIEADLLERGFPEETRWWMGTDVGLSSAALFSTLASHSTIQAEHYSRGAHPRDAADFGRCLRLVERFGWRPRLSEAARKLPPPWSTIIAHWDELCALPAAGQYALLRRIDLSESNATMNNQ